MNGGVTLAQPRLYLVSYWKEGENNRRKGRRKRKRRKGRRKRKREERKEEGREDKEGK